MSRFAFVTLTVCAFAVLLGERATAGVTLPGDINWYTMTVDEVMYKSTNLDTLISSLPGQYVWM